MELILLCALFPVLLLGAVAMSVLTELFVYGGAILLVLALVVEVLKSIF